MKKKLESFTSKTLKAIAKEIKLKGYSSLNTDELREALVVELKKAENKDYDLSKWETPVEAAPGPEEGTKEALVEETGSDKTVSPAVKKGLMIPRRTTRLGLFGRR